jgi:protein CpxP
MLQVLRAARPILGAGLAAAWLLASGAPSRAAMMASGAAPGPRASAVLPVQAPVTPPAPNIEANLAQLHQRLQITPAQEPRFAAFANVMRANSRMTPGAPPANPSAVDDLRVTIQIREQELSALRRLLPPLQALYASLSPAQQKTADQVFRQGPAE